MTATVAQGKDPEYYDQEETKQEKSKKGRKDIENYYSEEGSSLGSFYGLGAKELGLFNTLTEKGDLRKLIKGINPRTGEVMFKHRESNCQFTDICFSAPKDFSLIAELDVEHREEYEALQIRAVKRALDRLQPKLYRRKNSKNEKEFNMKPIHLLYNHKTSRPLKDRRPDMQWHTHCPTLKMALDENNNWKTLFNYPIFNNQKLLGAEYRAELANGLREMGFEIIPTMEEFEEENNKGGIKNKVSSFKIRHITKSQRDMFSGRSLEINQSAKPGATSIDKYNIAQNIKRTKVQWDDQELRNIWKEDAKSVGLTKDTIRRMKTFNDSSINHSKTEEYIIASSMRKGKLFEFVLDIKPAENEQNTGETAKSYKQHLIDMKYIERIGNGYEFKVNIDITNAFNRNKQWKRTIKMDFKKSQKIFNERKESIKTDEFKPISKDLDNNQFKFKNTDIKVVLNKINNKTTSHTYASQTISNIESLRLQIGNLYSKLLDMNISEKEKFKIQEEIKKLQAEINELKIKEINKDNSNRPSV